jgi:acyl carrier protein
VAQNEAPTMTSPLHETIRDYILEAFVFTADRAVLGPDESLTGRGIANSTGMLDIVLFVEQRFGVRVGDEDILPENFDSINAIATFVSARLPAAR